MFKKLLLILALICMIVLPVFGQSGNYTTNKYFYLPEYGAYGMDEYNEYNLYMEKADNQIEANKATFGSYYLKTEIDTLSKVETIYSKDITDSDELATALTDYYLKTAINTQSKMETIWDVTLATDTELAALKFTDLADTPAAYDNGKYAKSTADGVVWDTPAGYINLTSFVEQTSWRLFYSNADGDVIELPLGTDGQVLNSNGVDVAPTFEDPTGGGEANTASNVGTGGGVFKQKTGVDLELRKIEAGSNKINVSWYTEGEYTLKESFTATSGTNSDAIYALRRYGMNFTTTSAHNVKKVSIYLKKIGSPADDLHIGIKAVDGDMKPTGLDLAGGTILASDAGTDFGWVDCVFATTCDLSDATKYSIVFSSPDSADSSNCYAIHRNVDNAYTEGGTVWSINGGSSWTVAEESDHKFKIYSIGINYKDQIEIDVVPSEIAKEIGGLLSTTTVSFAADVDTTLYTVPTGKRCVLTHAIVVAADDAGATTTVSIGANGAETDFIPANTLSNLDAEYDSVILQPIPNTTPLKIKSYAAATVIEAQVASQSGAAGNTIYLFGILY